ncbi:MAG: DUF3168 domain-containing protein [Beijerinckiaceae bacterium]
MSAIPILIQMLLDDAGVAALVEDRVHAVQAPQNTALPSIVVLQTSEAEDYSIDHSTAGYPEARLTVICRASTAGGAISLGDAVIAALRSKQEGVDSSPATLFKADIDSTDFVDAQKLFRRILGWSVYFRR